jgi:uncharacterized protein (TIGR03437 family)
VIAVNPDGQSSAFVQDPAPTFAYEAEFASGAASPVATISPASLPAGSIARVDITSPTGNFADGQVWVGFGTSDIVVQRVWVVDGSTLRANIAVLPGANPGLVQPSVVSGLQVVAVQAFEITPANPQQLNLNVPALNVSTGTPYLYPGATAAVSVANATTAVLNRLATGALTLDGKPVPMSIFGSQIVFQIPAAQNPGLALLRLDSPDGRGNGVWISIETAPPQITALTNGSKEIIDASRPVRGGDTVVLLVTGLGEPDSKVSPSHVTVSFAGAEVTPTGITASGAMFQVTATVPVNVTAAALNGAVPLTISIDGHTSEPASLSVR